MKIEKNTLFLKTDNRFFWMERDGRKPYTVRILNHEEYTDLCNAWLGVNIDTIYIQNADNSAQSFERKILSIVPIGELFGKYLVGIAWKVGKKGND